MDIKKLIQKTSPDQFARYMAIVDIIQFNYNDRKKVAILDVGGNHNGIINDLLEIKYELSVLDPEVKSDKPSRIFKGTADNIPFKDNHFDLVISSDTLEHIEKKKRKASIKEMYRVAKDGLIIVFPQEKGTTVSRKEYEEIFNNSHKSVIGEENRWLKEHFEFGIPTEAEILKILKSLRVSNYAQIRSQNINIWVTLNLLETYQKALIKYFSFEPEYSQILFDYFENYKSYDVGECYRTGWVISKNKNLEIPKTDQKHDTTSLIKFIKQISLLTNRLIKNYSLITDTNTSLNQEIQNLSNHIVNLRKEVDQIARLTQTIDEKNQHIKTFQSMIEEKDQHIENFQSMVEEKDQHIENFQRMLSERDKVIDKERKVYEKQREQIAILENTIFNPQALKKSVKALIFKTPDHK